jgi:hypothetical protein
MNPTSGKAIASLVLGILSFCLSFLAGIPGAILGILALVQIGNSQGQLQGRGMAITGLVLSLVGSLMVTPLLILALLLPAVQKVRQAANNQVSMNNLHQIGIAMHAYHNERNTLPPPAIYDRDGKPLLSWRVAILPYLENQDLYHRFKLDEPWDGPNNLPLIKEMPKVYLLPAEQEPGATDTYYQVIVGKDTLFRGARGVRFFEIVDGTSNTILAVEANRAVPWTKPEDLTYEEGGPLPQLGTPRSPRFHVLFGDGSARSFTPGQLPPDTLKFMILRNDGNPIQIP